MWCFPGQHWSEKHCTNHAHVVKWPQCLRRVFIYIILNSTLLITLWAASQMWRPSLWKISGLTQTFVASSGARTCTWSCILKATRCWLHSTPCLTNSIKMGKLLWLWSGDEVNSTFWSALQKGCDLWFQFHCEFSGCVCPCLLWGWLAGRKSWQSEDLLTPVPHGSCAVVPGCQNAEPSRLFAAALSDREEMIPPDYPEPWRWPRLCTSHSRGCLESARG